MTIINNKFEVSEGLVKLLGSPEDFLTNTISLAEQLGLPITGNEIDHFCFRCESTLQYRRICDEILSLNLGSLLIEGMIGGRPISTVQLTDPLVYKEWKIPCLELTCPKSGRFHSNGYEHIEVVIDTDKVQGFVNSAAYLDHFASKYPSVDFDRKAINKEINADLSVTLSNGASVKFHARPLYEVCAHEVQHNHFIPVPTDYFSSIVE